ncbi:hypothetical protein QJS83_12165 [Bdellovibrio sp. 22V]|uniref:hypothetical protein n=1 Tax=Bdellovibrio TaxID=958 RepID=UPI0025432EB7|nr:hypothetical protein [Bdellovibrio sp. 22V]WII71215.1 hypothetical protein QJS83_12165 [Bdellovibrio sp. 22V]
MAMSVLSQASALNPGSDLWIVPDLDKSQWTAKLDWYLNFQICKSTRHLSPSLPNYLRTVLAETELEKKSIDIKPSAPLMIATHELLPNKWVVLLPWDGNLKQWTTQVFEIWQKLKEPSLRVFLPPGQSTGNLQLAWQTHHTFEDFTVVLD